MSQAVHLISKHLPGYGPSEGRCLPGSGVSVRAVSISARSVHGYSQVNIGSLRCGSKRASLSCKANSGGHRRHSDFSRQTRQGRKNRQNEDRDNFENVEESDMFASKNGPLLSLSSTPKFQATATPGPREKEIVELFRKVQAQLRERAAVKEDKKVDASQRKGKESETVDSLLKLLRKHSIDQGKKKTSNVTNGDFAVDQPEQNGPYNENKSTSYLSSNNRGSNSVAEPDAPFTRPPSNFRRKSPVPQAKFQPIYSREEPVNSTTELNSTAEEKTFEMDPKTAQQPEPELDLVLEEEPESDSELEQEPSFPDGDVFDELSEDESNCVDDDIDDVDDDIDDDEDKQQLSQHEDLSSLKLPELRALAKSRGLKGFSKMKKGDLVDLLSGAST